MIFSIWMFCFPHFNRVSHLGSDPVLFQSRSLLLPEIQGFCSRCSSQCSDKSTLSVTQQSHVNTFVSILTFSLIATCCLQWNIISLITLVLQMEHMELECEGSKLFNYLLFQEECKTLASKKPKMLCLKTVFSTMFKGPQFTIYALILKSWFVFSQCAEHFDTHL